MSHTIVNPEFIHSSASDIELMQSYMATRATSTIEAIKEGIDEFSELEDNEISQIAQDAGYTLR